MRILFTTCYLDHGYYDYFSLYCPGRVRLKFHLRHSAGLRFIKANLPEIEILEYPTYRQFKEKLSQGWDVVGFSFYTHETNKILRMAETARAAGTSELWAGNYGVFNPGMDEVFDRVFTGYAEHDIAEALGKKIERLKHPPIVHTAGLHPLPVHFQKAGLLQTTRGCVNKCSFCQGPLFSKKPQALPLESIEEILAYYKARRIDWVVITDENFGINREHSRRVVELFAKYGLFWSCESDIGIALKNLDVWNTTRFMGLGVGVESIHANARQILQKKHSNEQLLELKEEIDRNGNYYFGFYMLGHEKDTFQGVLDALETVYGYGFAFTQATVMTPFPQTPLWDEIESRYGFNTNNWDYFDTRHLVWNHPTLSPAELEKLFAYAARRLNNTFRFLQWMGRIYRIYLRHLGTHRKSFSFISSFPAKAYMYPD
ncbi:MAG: radical SAM protein [Deltaproteobacteria bacterium]|nr:radical SAM protein [Deltaproteobacteria bacterium]